MADSKTDALRHSAAAQAAGGSEEARRHRAIFESAVDFAIIATNRDGLITDWNSGAENIFGWSAEEMIGSSAARFFTPEDREQDRVAIEMQRALADGRASDERWHQRSDGSRFWANGEMMPLRDDEGTHIGFLKILRDRTRERHAADELRNALGLNTLILQSSRDCIVVLDLDGRTLMINAGGVESVEIEDASSVLGLSWLRDWQGESEALARDAVAAACAGGIGRFQGFCPTHRGTPKWWDVVVSPLPGPDGQPERLVSIGRDITALKQAEQRLAEGEERQRTLIEMLPQLVWTCPPDGRCDYLSPQWVAYTGIPAAEQLGLQWLDRVIHPDDRERTATHWMGAVNGLHGYDIEYRIRRHDGVYRWFKTRGTPIHDAAGQIAYWFGTCTDMQDIVEARDVMARSQSDLERIVAERTRERDRAWTQSLDLQVVVDRDGVIRAANDAWTKILGWLPEEVVGHSHLDFNHPEHREQSEQALHTATESNLPTYETRCLHKDGSFRWISWVATPEQGLVYASGRHVTAEKEAAALLESMQDQLRQSQKMEAVGQLTGGLAHDFNNLLTGISGSLELLQMRIGQGRLENVDRYVTAAQGAVKRAAALTHRLLAFSRRQTLAPKPTDINRLIAGIEELVRRTVGPEIDVEVTAGADLWITLVDPNQLESALLNLCINARDAMPDGGRLTIATSNHRLGERAARERDLPAGPYVLLSVTDTGTGMAPDVVKRAFDPFYTTKPIGMGTGLGLSMVYGFARQSGGQVHIESQLGRGTTMSLVLPRHHGREEHPEGQAAPAASPRSEQGETVLIVDDEATVRMLVAEVLQELGYTAIEASDGAGGLQALASEARIDLLVTDVGLPGGTNGRQMADAGRVLRPGLKVLFITGYAENAVVGSAHLEPGMQVLTKPFTMDALASRVKALIAQQMPA